MEASHLQDAVAPPVPPICGFPPLCEGMPSSQKADEVVRSKRNAGVAHTFPQKNNQRNTAKVNPSKYSVRRPKHTTPGIFSTFTSAAILEHSPPVAAGTPEIDPPTWKDAVLPADAVMEIAAARALYQTHSSTVFACSQPTHLQWLTTDEPSDGVWSHSELHEVNAHPMVESMLRSPPPSDTWLRSVFADTPPQPLHKRVLKAEVAPSAISRIAPSPTIAACLPSDHLPNCEEQLMHTIESLSIPSCSSSKEPATATEDGALSHCPPRTASGIVPPTPESHPATTGSPTRGDRAAEVLTRENVPHPSTVHSSGATTAEEGAEDRDAEHATCPATLSGNPQTQMETHPNPTRQKARLNGSRTTPCVARLPPPPRGLPLVAASASPGDSAKCINSDKRGAIHFATADRVALRRAKEEPLVMQPESQPRRTVTLVQGKKPKGYDAIAEEGLRKRRELEETALRRSQQEESHLTFKPVISKHALRRADNRAFSTAAFAASTQEWLEQREKHIEALRKQKIEGEQALEKKRFVNKASEALAVKRRKTAVTADQSVFAWLSAEASRIRMGKAPLVVHRTPSSQPRRGARTKSRNASTRDTANNASPSAADAPERVNRVEHTPKAGGAHEDASEVQRSSAVGQRPPTSFRIFDRLYQRTTELKAHTQRIVEAQREEALRAAALAAKGPRRTAQAISEHVLTMMTREKIRQAKWKDTLNRLKMKKLQPCHLSVPASTRTAALAQRARVRLHKQHMTKAKASQPKPVANVVRTAPTRSAAFLMRGQILLERQQRGIERIRQEMLRAELGDCTFKPQVCAASERMARKMRMAYTDCNESLVSANTRRSSSGEARWPPSSDYRGFDRDAGRIPLGRQERRPLLNATNGAASEDGLSPLPSAPIGWTAGDDTPRDTSLETEIASLEDVLTQWRQLERDAAFQKS